MTPPPRRLRRLRRALHAVGVALCVASPATAQTPADVARRALIDEASAAARAGEHARAIELGTRALTLRATPSLQYFLAREHLAEGHAVEALALAGECASGARADPEVNHREALLARCVSIAAAAEGRVARLTVHVRLPAPQGLRVTVGGDALSPALYDIAVPVAAGAVEVTAAAPGHAPLREALTLRAGERSAMTVALVAVPPPAPPAAHPGRVSAPSPSARGSSPGAGPWVTLGVGVGALVTGGVLAAVAAGAREERDAACPAARRCDVDAALGADGRYRGASVGANVAFVVGGVSVAAAVAWWLLARGRATEPPRVALTPAGLTLRW